jgi:hypothetical protein
LVLGRSLSTKDIRHQIYKDLQDHHFNRVATHHIEDFKEVPIPWRRESTFKLLPHADNGFYENKWTYTEKKKKSNTKKQSTTLWKD